MPIFEFECAKCGYNFESIVSLSDRVSCPKCGARNVRKLLSSFSFSVAGGGSSKGTDSCGSCKPSASKCSGCR